jgi:hypothetical protein
MEESMSLLEESSCLEPLCGTSSNPGAEELIQKIGEFPTSAQFLHWVSDGKCEMRSPPRKKTSEQETMMFQFYVQGVLVFTARVELNLKRMNAEAADALFRDWPPKYETIISLGISKKLISRGFAEPYYNVVSEVSIKNQLCGITWEIFDISELMKIYEHLHHPSKIGQSKEQLAT